MANPKKDDGEWHPDDEENEEDLIDKFEGIFLDEDGEIRWITIFVILLGIAAFIDWRRDWVWLHGIQKAVAYLNIDMADPSSTLALLA